MDASLYHDTEGLCTGYTKASLAGGFPLGNWAAEQIQWINSFHFQYTFQCTEASVTVNTRSSQACTALHSKTKLKHNLPFPHRKRTNDELAMKSYISHLFRSFYHTAGLILYQNKLENQPYSNWSTAFLRGHLLWATFSISESWVNSVLITCQDILG